MPFGLTNALAMFQCLMESCLGEMHLKWCIIYLDDVIVFSKTPEEHIERLKGVFEKLSAAGLRLKLSKCEFFKSKLPIWDTLFPKMVLRQKRKRQLLFKNGQFQKQYLKYVASSDL